MIFNVAWAFFVHFLPAINSILLPNSNRSLDFSLPFNFSSFFVSYFFSPLTCPVPLYLLEIPSICSLFLVLLFSPSAFSRFSFYFFSPLTCPVPLYLLEIQSCFLRLATRYLHGRRSNLQWRIDLPIFRAKSIAKD